MNAETPSASREVALTFGHSIQTFGETGDMNGLELFLKTTSSRKNVEGVHAVRGPIVAADFKERQEAQPKDEMEKQVLATGKEQFHVDRDKNLIRFVLPITSDKSCLSCHNLSG